jgi:hypothetical protein
METAHRNNWTEVFQNIYKNLLSIQNERISANIKLAIDKALIRSVMSYACPAWELEADTYFLKLQRM